MDKQITAKFSEFSPHSRTFIVICRQSMLLALIIWWKSIHKYVTVGLIPLTWIIT